MITIKQGDSLWLEITGFIEDVDTVWDNWSGLWAISSALGSAPLHSGDLIRTAIRGKFLYRLPTTVSNGLQPADYVLTIQVSDPTVDYREEIMQDALRVTTQGIP